jgi:formylglycine-generating enzyme required for sulfatase activity
MNRKSGVNWRLPSDEEWSYAAGSRFVDDALGDDGNEDNPAKRWLLKYQKYTNADTGSDPVVKPRGSYDVNENGIFDMSGNVWEWTNSCYERVRIVEGQKPTDQIIVNCGVRIIEGQHRAYITNCIRDARGGGCSVGAPPDHLGFRLVKDIPSPLSIRGIQMWWQNLIGS